MSLAEFILQRIAEDEAVARGATVGTLPAALVAFEAEDRDGVTELLIDPERVLAECASKRAIVEMHDSDGWDFACEVEGGGLPDPDDCRTLRELASIYAGHPDFRDEWRVES